MKRNQSMMRMARPAHPGQFIRMEVIEPLDLPVTKAAKILGVSRPALSALLNASAALSPRYGVAGGEGVRPDLRIASEAMSFSEKFSRFSFHGAVGPCQLCGKGRLLHKT